MPFAIVIARIIILQKAKVVFTSTFTLRASSVSAACAQSIPSRNMFHQQQQQSAGQPDRTAPHRTAQHTLIHCCRVNQCVLQPCFQPNRTEPHTDEASGTRLVNKCQTSVSHLQARSLLAQMRAHTHTHTHPTCRHIWTSASSGHCHNQMLCAVADKPRESARYMCALCCRFRVRT